ncbi:hypothetical protein AB0L65_20765 [Nonomuraea sp. NPDC052116]|uniref:hypothetical protein n=1 Tax=Nonomuraea sp. NPDC052116 TaxID=3155665 RepID=UPI00343B8760
MTKGGELDPGPHAPIDAISDDMSASHDQVITFSVSVNMDGCTKPAEDQVALYVQRFADDLARETMRLEEGSREQDLRGREIISSMVVKANKVIRSPAIDLVPRGPDRKYTVTLQSASFCLAIVAGVFGSYLNSTWQWVAFVILFIAATASQVISLILTWRKQ